jgi:hypothetical protein
LITRFVQRSAQMNRIREIRWRDVLPESAAPAAGSDLEVLEPASLPQPIGPNRLLLIAAGLGSGLLLGLLAAVAGRRPKFALRLAGFAAAGSALGLAASFLITDIYVSSAVMRFTQPLVPDEVAGLPAAAPLADRLAAMQHDVLSRGSLAAIVQMPKLDLYAKQRAGAPLEDVVETMRRNISMRPLDMPGRTTGHPFAFRIAFTYPDRWKAQIVVRELVTRFVERNIADSRARSTGAKDGELMRLIEERKMGENLEVLDAASLPEAPVSPNRLVLTVSGLAFGLLSGALLLRLQAHRRLSVSAL